MHVLTWILLVILVVYGASCLILFFAQRRIIFEPQYQPPNPLPETLSLPYETIKLGVGAGDKLVGWWFPCPEGNGKTVFFLHGNGGYDPYNFHTLQILHDLGFGVLMLNYRGYGLSTNVFPNEQRVYQDAICGYTFLREQRQVKPQDLLLYGHSMGGAIAIELASRFPVAGLFLESTFTSMLEMSVKKPYTRIFPLKLLLTQRFDSRSKLPSLQIPIFLCHGTADETVPSCMSEQLMAIANEPKNIEIIPGADHHNLPKIGEKQITQSLKWLTQQLQWQTN